MRDLWRGQSGDERGRDRDRVRDASDIVRVIGEHVALKPKGREYVCLCPFHNDHNPSMRVVPAKQIFHCFVCQTGGDVFTFAMKFHKMEFREALEYLAERAGITLTPLRPQAEGDHAPTASRRELLDACALATAYYQHILKQPEVGSAAREIIARRGISAAMVEKFALGAATDSWEGLYAAARKRGVSEAALIAAGLAKQRERGDGCFDMLRNRLIFPICDKAGRPVAFGGRKIKEEDEPKYLNTPETQLFNKSATLYALHHASRAIQTEKTVLVTEGYMDAIACHQAGFCNAIATLGTALTTEHAAALRPLCDTVVLLFDGDDAGQKAADRATAIFFAEPIDVRIATLAKFTDAKDPDELLKREGGAAVFRTVLANATDLLEYRFARVRQRLAGAGVAALSKGILSEIEALTEMGLRDVEPVRQRLIVRRLAELGGLDEATVLRVLPAGRKGRDMPARDSGESEQTDPLPNFTNVSLPAHVHMLGCLLCDGSLWNAMTEREKDFITPTHMPWDALRRIAQLVLDIGEDGGSPDLAAVLRLSEDEQITGAAVALTRRIEMETEADPNRLASHWRGCVTRALLDGQNTRNMGPEAQIDVKTAVGNERDSVIQRLLDRKQQHSHLGADRRVLPKRT